MNKIRKIFDDTNGGGRWNRSKLAALEDTKIDYTIFFTPRSGSSWLKNMLFDTNILGNPGEWFNTENLPGILSNFPKTNPEEYLSWIRKVQRSPNLVFGLEISFFHLKLVNECFDLYNSLQCPAIFYLKREDFVAQAVSLYFATETSYFHAVQKNPARMLYDQVIYDDNKMKSWCKHILQQEYGFQRYFSHKNLRPVEFTYEQLCDSPRDIVRAICRHVLGEGVEVTSVGLGRHRKTGGSLNNQYANAFRKQNAEFVNYWENNRGLEAVW